MENRQCLSRGLPRNNRKGFIMNCTQCGKLLPEANSPFCPFCGATQSGNVTNPAVNQESAEQPAPMQTVAEQLEATQPEQVAPMTGFPSAAAGSGTPFDPTLPPQPEKKRMPAWAIALIAGGIALALAICCCIAMVGFFADEFVDELERELDRIEAELYQGSDIDPIVVPNNDSDDSAAIDNNGGDLTMSQQQAIRAAENYLSWMSFSKEGLIHQLSSEFGDGFPEADARFAVESLDVDWYEQAVKSAESYLEFMSFSRQGLIDQLTSDIGGFTIEQAEHAADAVGL